MRQALVPLFVTLIVFVFHSESLIVDVLDYIYHRTHKLDLYDKYVDIPKRDSQFLEPVHKQVREALNKLQIEPDSTPEEILKIIEEAKSREEDESHGAIYEQLVSLANNEANCSKPLIELIKSIQAQFRSRRKSIRMSVAKIEEFIKHYGKHKLEMCDKEIRLAEGLACEGAAVALEEFFRAFLLIPHDVNELAFCSLLARLDLVDGRYDVEQPLRVARKYVTIERLREKQKQNTEVFVRIFFSDKCDELWRELGDVFDIINLAQAFGASQKHDLKLLKLNEFNRLCLSWKNNHLRIGDRFYGLQQAVVGKLYPTPSDGEA